MVFLVGGANSAADTGYDIENSLRIEKGDSAYLSDALSSPNTDIFTISMWLKIVYNDSNTTFCEIGKTLTGEAGSNTTFNPHIGYGRIAFNAYDGVANAYRIRWGAPGSFRYRDPAAWYHVVMRMDSSQAVAASRARFYINGEDISSKLTHTTDPDQNDDYFNATGSSIYFGGANIGGGGYWDGYMADVAYIDGTSYAPGTFAETDEDSGIWKPKDFKSDVTWGTNGIFLEFKQSGTGTNASGLGADTSGNDNHMAATNLAATDQTTDTPTNNFCTMNSLDKGTITLSEGNTKIVCDGSNNDGCKGTIGFPSSGKWYFEYYMSAHDGGDAPQIMGIGQGGASNDTWVASGNYIVYEIDSGNKRIDQSSSSYGATATTGDTIGVAVNMDDNEVIFYKDGSTQGTISNAIITGSDYYLPYIMDGSSVRSHETYANFGNPAFSISSGNADANGYGNFEFSVPSGHYALCTKNLAEYG